MPRPRLPYLQKQVTRHGVVVWYVRRGVGPRIRIRAAYGSPEFFAEYQIAVASITATQPRGNVRAGTLEWLIRRYRESSAWAALAPATRDQRENIFRHVEKQAGDVPFKAITRAKIVEGREKRKATPNQANNFIKSMRGLFSWAVDMEHVSVDPTRDVKLLNVKTDGFHVWTDDEVAQFEARWPIGTRERLAFDLLLFTGLRRSAELDSHWASSPARSRRWPSDHRSRLPGDLQDMGRGGRDGSPRCDRAGNGASGRHPG